MKRRLAAFVLFSVLLAGGYSIGFVPTEKMQVKQMWGRQGRACFNALLGENHQIQLARNYSPANNRQLDC